MSVRISRRKLALAVGLGVPAALLARPVAHLGRAWVRDEDALPPLPAGKVDDASRMNESAVAEVVAPEGDEDAIVATLRAALARAKERGLPVCVAGARHTMGGHTIASGGVTIDTSRMNAIRVDRASRTATVGAGARWHDLIGALDPLGLAVSVMQSNDGFSVGGSMGANCHGWQPNRPPLASTVESFRLMLADGTVRECSRERDAELFSLVQGGYGLFGVVLSARVRVVENRMLVAERYKVPLDRWVETFDARAEGAELAFGRLCPAPSRLFEEALLTVYRADPSASGALPPVGTHPRSALARALFRGEVESDYGKELRWSVESTVGSEARARATRNQVMREPVALFQNRIAAYTDVLHEYFVPRASFVAFVERAREALRAHPACDLLNVTVRDVREDRDAFLRYARGDVLALVMLFCMRRTEEADAALGALARELVDVAVELGGSYYLPYRLHASPEQLRRAYRNADAFFARKRAWDPELRFRNRFWDTYA
jgi:FAD/FMN-containing dehydrogenase